MKVFKQGISFKIINFNSNAKKLKLNYLKKTNALNCKWYFYEPTTNPREDQERLSRILRAQEYYISQQNIKFW